MLYWNDVSKNYADWVKLLEDLGGEKVGDFEQEVWAQAKLYDDIPHFGNIRQSMLFEKIRQAIEIKYPFLCAEYAVNGVNSHFYVNDRQVDTLHDLDKLLGEYCRTHDVVIVEEGADFMVNQDRAAAHISAAVSKLNPKAMREIFMTMWRDADGLNEGLSADDCIEIFASALKGSSDFTYELLAQTCSDYGVGTVNENFVLLPRERYDELFSDVLKGNIPDQTELDTEALVNLLCLENTAQIEANIINCCLNETHSMSSDGKYIYENIGIYREKQWRIADFMAHYLETRWLVEYVTH